jgi:hypothetical protein
MTTMLGELLPSDVADALDNVPEGDGSPDPTSALELKVLESVFCLAFRADPDEAVVTVPEVKAARVLEDKLKDPGVGTESGTEVGMATGQNDQTFLPWSQYRSSSNLRKPTASRLERQSPEVSSS